jgi:hypothetical protein
VRTCRLVLAAQHGEQMRGATTAILAMVAAASCSPWPGLQNSDAGFSGGTRVADRSGDIGSECGTDVTCAAGLTCLTTAPSGLCTKACASDKDCGDSSCQVAFGGLFCLPTCASDQQCRDQYACLTDGTVSVCAPASLEPDAAVPAL